MSPWWVWEVYHSLYYASLYTPGYTPYTLLPGVPQFMLGVMHVAGRRSPGL